MFVVLTYESLKSTLVFPFKFLADLRVSKFSRNVVKCTQAVKIRLCALNFVLIQ